MMMLHQIMYFLLNSSNTGPDNLVSPITPAVHFVTCKEKDADLINKKFVKIISLKQNIHSVILNISQVFSDHFVAYF